MADIDTHMPGDPAAVHRVADWLKTFHSTMDDAGATTKHVDSLSYPAWRGASGDAYRDFNDDLRKATHELEDRSGDAEDKVRSYAQQLAWRQQDMGEHRATARDGGLTVVGTVIRTPPTPVSPGDLPAGSTQAEEDRWERDNAAFEAANDKVELYNDLLEDVRRTFETLDTWVQENLVTMEKQASSPLTVAALAGVALGIGLGVPENLFTRKSSALQVLAAETAAALARGRSGNPAVRAGSKPPRQASLEKASKAGTRAGRLLSHADDAARAAKFVARGNVVGALVIGGIEIAQGKSPSSVALETGASLAAGAAAAAGITALVAAGVVTAPVWATTAVVVGVGAAAAAGAGWAYETFVPQATREKIDEGIRDGWDATGGKVVEGAKDTWDKLFG